MDKENTQRPGAGGSGWKLDHKNLNLDNEFFKELNLRQKISALGSASCCVQRLMQHSDLQVRLYENRAEFCGINSYHKSTIPVLPGLSRQKKVSNTNEESEGVDRAIPATDNSQNNDPWRTKTEQYDDKVTTGLISSYKTGVAIIGWRSRAWRFAENPRTHGKGNVVPDARLPVDTLNSAKSMKMLVKWSL